MLKYLRKYLAYIRRVTLLMHMRLKTTRGRLAQLPENRVKQSGAVSIVRWKEAREAETAP